MTSLFGSLSDDVIAGGMAGLVARMLTAPFDVLKIRYQLNTNNIAASESLWKAMRMIVHDEGITALWKGNVPALCLWVSYAMAQFALYDILKAAVHADETASTSRKPEVAQHSHQSSSGRRAIYLFIAGAIASSTATLLTYPFDITRTQFALQGKKRTFVSMTSFASHTLAAKGFRGLFTGMGPAVLSVTPYMGLNFAIYDSLKSALPDGHYNETHGWSRTIKKGVLGGIAGGVSKFLVYPLDTVKKRLQANAFHENVGTMVSCSRTILQTDGLKGFYRVRMLPTYCALNLLILAP